MTKPNEYQLNEKDIESVIRYLKTIDPENATPEMAIAILEHLKTTYHTMNHEDPETLKKIFEELKKEKLSKS